MSRKDDLLYLMNEIEAGRGVKNDGALFRLFGDNWAHVWDVLIYPSANNLNAAYEAHKALLGEHVHYQISAWPLNPMSVVYVSGGDGEGRAKTPARAWVLAILDALVAKEIADNA